jgi:membrane-bound lytic murein transglycosylase D
MSSAIILKNPEKYGFKIPRNKPLTYDIVEVEKSADLSILAKAAESRLSVIKKLNPELRQPATPSNKVYQLKIPIGKKDIFIKNFNSIPDDEKFAIQRVEHRVGKGENLISIASKYRVSVADLQSINNITNVNKVYIGQKLKIPIKGGIYSNYPDKITYVVKSGDTLGHIAEDYKTRASEIRKWNNMGNSSSIYPGQKLTLFVNRITESSSSQSIEYIVKSGDSLIRIAEKYKVSVKQINEWNKLTSSIIYPGQKLKINTN